jgi:aminoglycoside 6'-N-acetyltransferase
MALISLRAVTLEDAGTLERWDHEPHVISATSDDPKAEKAFGDHDWRQAIPLQSAVSHYLMAELDGRPIGALQVIDPHLEPEHYWGDTEPNLRAIDIWIGEASCLGQGHGERIMRAAINACFSDDTVTGILIDPLNSNTRSHRFYQRLGFKVVGRRSFDGDDCLVHRLHRVDWRP